MTKKKELSNGFINYKKDITNLSNQYIEMIQNLNKISYSFSYQWYFFKARIIQLFAQQFNWETRQKIKKVIKIFTPKSKTII
jgi:hypothetical protein